jgi:hypothetical protein
LLVDPAAQIPAKNNSAMMTNDDVIHEEVGELPRVPSGETAGSLSGRPRASSMGEPQPLPPLPEEADDVIIRKEPENILGKEGKEISGKSRRGIRSVVMGKNK